MSRYVVSVFLLGLTISGFIFPQQVHALAFSDERPDRTGDYHSRLV